MTHHRDTLGRRAASAIDDLGATGGDLGDPGTDRPFTWRIHPDCRPLDLTASRVLRTTDPGRAPWLEVSGDMVGWRYSDAEVRLWPYTTAEDAEAAGRLGQRGETRREQAP